MNFLELRASTGRQDLVTARKSAAIGSPLALLAANMRGFFDAVSLSLRILFSRSGFARDYLKQVNEFARDQYGHIDALPVVAQATQTLPAKSRLGFGSETPHASGPKSPAPWI